MSAGQRAVVTYGNGSKTDDESWAALKHTNITRRRLTSMLGSPLDPPSTRSKQTETTKTNRWIHGPSNTAIKWFSNNLFTAAGPRSLGNNSRLKQSLAC